MEQFYYALALCFSISGLLFIDYRFTLAFWHNRIRTAYTVVISVGIFIIWDLIGIGLGIFFSGNTRYALPIRILPEFPIEELLFLFLLCYVTLLIYLGVRKQWPPIS